MVENNLLVSLVAIVAIASLVFMFTAEAGSVPGSEDVSGMAVESDYNPSARPKQVVARSLELPARNVNQQPALVEVPSEPVDKPSTVQTTVKAKDVKVDNPEAMSSGPKGELVSVEGLPYQRNAVSRSLRKQYQDHGT